MKLLVSIFSLMYLSSAQAVELEVVIESIESQRGQMVVALFDNAEDFLTTPVYFKYVQEVQTQQMQVLFTDVEPGQYSISIIHDWNSNGELDTNIFGIPKEPFGFSNNPPVRTGPPSFEDCLINVGEESSTIINLINRR